MPRIAASESEPRTLPDAALCGPGRRELVFIHGSLAFGREGVWGGKGGRVATVERDAGDPDEEGEPPGKMV